MFFVSLVFLRLISESHHKSQPHHILPLLPINSLRWLNSADDDQLWYFFITDTNGFLCEFEKDDMCGWTNNHGSFDNYDWKRVNRQADAAGITGPRDGAGGGGYYMLADSSTIRAPSNNALFMSPRLGYSGIILLCLIEMFDHMLYGNV